MITAAGVGSGLDIEGLVTQLVAAERAPTANRLTREEVQLTAQLSAFGSFKGALASFQNTLTSLNDISRFSQRTTTSSDSDVVDVSSNGPVAAASYDVGVSQLAKSHSLASGSYASVTDTVGTGVLTIRFGTTDYTSPDPGPEAYNSFGVNPERGVATLTIDSSNNTLEGLRDAINDSNSGVSAAIVNDGSGFRLLLNSDQSGEENSLEIAVVDSGDANNTDANGLSALAFNSAATNLEQTVAAQDAIFTVNGLTINSATNNPTDVIDGVDLTLKNLTGAIPLSISIAEDREGITELITDFVAGYNTFIETVNNLSSFDAATGNSGALQGDFSARSIVAQVRQTLTSAVEGFNGPFSSLSEIGITTQNDGTLQVDSADLDGVLAQNFDEIVGLFAAVGFPTDGSVDYLSSTDKTVVQSYAIDITQVATRGQFVGSAIAFPMTIDANNDEFTISADGISSASIALTQGAYATGDALAAELQSRINGDSALSGDGVTVTVAFNVDRFEITSDRYGTGSRVEITAVDTNTAAQLGLSVATGTAGLDVAGTIGGVVATGTGQILTGAIPSDSEGLQLLIDGGAIGPRGTIDFSRGLAFQLDSILTGFLGADGPLDSRTEGIQGRVEDIEDRREILDRRMVALEARFRAQFNALDGLLAQLQTTSSFLSQQLDSLPGSGQLIGNS
ncbi:MAG: flagellar hook-associated protein 2 [Halioglobus sp.]|jgi:flagellar hook-associated protein 2